MAMTVKKESRFMAVKGQVYPIDANYEDVVKEQNGVLKVNVEEERRLERSGGESLFEDVVYDGQNWKKT